MTLISLCCTLPRVESGLLQSEPNSPREPISTMKGVDDNLRLTLPPLKNNNINWVKAERSWSGNLASRTTHLVKTTQMDPSAGKPKSNHRRFHSLSEVEVFDGEPKLVRSCGVRRNWSFEDIEENN